MVVEIALEAQALLHCMLLFIAQGQNHSIHVVNNPIIPERKALALEWITLIVEESLKACLTTTYTG